MRKIIWTCWLQGRADAPFIVRKCLQSWERENPGWEFRCLDATTVGRYLDLDEYIDLDQQEITAASLSDIIRILLLHEYGGVWVDATLYCNQPLDDWLETSLGTGFFAFCNPTPDRMLSSWFLACAPGNKLVCKWATHVVRYWDRRPNADDYFWFHHLFGELYTTDAEARAAWNAVPRVGASAPHALLTAGTLYRQGSLTDAGIDPTLPVFKLTYRLEPRAYDPGTILDNLLQRHGPIPDSEKIEARFDQPPTPFVGLRTTTENLGDHIQILAAERLFQRAGVTVRQRIDRDDDIGSAPELDTRYGILLNGWFKNNPAEWPPHPNLLALYLGFHVRLFQAPSLVSDAALQHYRAHGPVGCRDTYTLALLRAHGVDAVLSNCLSLLLPRRLSRETQTEILAVSRDERILGYLPPDLGPVSFINHYSGTRDFPANLTAAAELLSQYRDRAKLIITTLLHCALPALAMGIPVVVFYPLNPPRQHQSDRERFSTLERMVRVYHMTEQHLVDWSGQRADVGGWKLRLIDSFFTLASRWNLPQPRALGPIAPAEALPEATPADIERLLKDPRRMAKLRAAGAPDRMRWGNPASYQLDWAGRAQLAAALLPDGAKVLEIGTGTGDFRRLVEPRCDYTGADLQPLTTDTIVLDLDNDPLPATQFDYIVALGVIEYLHNPSAAAAKLCQAASSIIVTYCARPETLSQDSSNPARQARGWINAYTETEFVALFEQCGHRIVSRTSLNQADDFEQYLMVFARAPLLEP